MTVSDEAYAAILGATAQIEWSVLEPHFARGDLLAVAAQLDLVAVAPVDVRVQTILDNLVVMVLSYYDIKAQLALVQLVEQKL